MSIKRAHLEVSMDTPLPHPHSPEAAGLIGGEFGYRLLKLLGRYIVENERAAHSALPQTQIQQKLERFFGSDIWGRINGKTVIDLGCAAGSDAVALAKGGACTVIGIDSRRRLLDEAIKLADTEHVSGMCNFVSQSDEQADLIFSIDRFEHDENPAETLATMRRLIKPGGRVLVSFGPLWYHPRGGHLFSVFPWAHLIFSEPCLIRWRSDFKSDGATCFANVEGGLNRMTLHRFRRVLAESDFEVERLEAVPIKWFRLLHCKLTEEVLTSVVLCVLKPRRNSHGRILNLDPVPRSLA